MNKKAQGLSLNTIIIAIIVLTVLVVIILVFTGAFGTIINPGLNECEKKPNQHCFSEACGKDAEYLTQTYESPGIGKCPEDKKCCMNIGKLG